jgi:N-formylglutamate amidohydrolase
MQVCIQHIPKNNAVPVVASLPHSGTYVPIEIDSLFQDQQRQWLRNTDWYLPAVYNFLPELGVTMIEATHSRYVVDLNRDPAGELYGSFSSALIAHENLGDQVYVARPDSNALSARVLKYHTPYHSTLKNALAETVKRFGRVLLLDLHSFMGPIEYDVCLGDRFGTTCSADVTGLFHTALAAEGFSVVRNSPFSGGHIIRAQARPPTVEALQVELRYTTYLDCTNIDQPGRPKLDPFRVAAIQVKLRPAMERVIASLSEGWLTPLQPTAEKRGG